MRGNSRKKAPLRWLLFFVSTIFSVLALAVYCILSNQYAYQAMKTKTDDIEQGGLSQTNIDVSNQFIEIESYISGNLKNKKLLEDINQYLQMEASDWEKKDLYEKILMESIITRSVHESTQDTYIVTSKGLIYTNPSVSTISFRDTVQRVERFLTHQDISNSEIAALLQTEQIVMLPKGYRDEKSNIAFLYDTFVGRMELSQGEEAFLVLTMRDDWLQRIIGENYQDLLIVDAAGGQMVWNSSPKAADVFEAYREKVLEEESAVFYQEERQNLLVEKLKYKNLYMILIKNQSAITSSIFWLQMFGIFIAVLCILLNLLFSSFTAKKISAPLAQLMETSKKYRRSADLTPIKIRRIKYSMGEVITSYIAGITLFSLLFYHAAYWSFSANLMQNAVKDSIRLSVSQTANNFSAFALKNKRISQNIMFDQTVQKYLCQLPWTEEESQKVNEAVLRNLEPADYACTVILYDGDWNPLLNTTGKEDVSLSEKQKEKLAQSLGEPHYFYFQDNRRNQVYLQCLRKVKNIYPDSKQEEGTIGYIQLVYDTESFSTIYQKAILPDSRASLLFEDGFDLLGGTGLLPEEGFVVTEKCVQTPWTYTVTVPFADITQDSQYLFWYGLGIILAAVTLSYLVACLFVKMLRRPVVSILGRLSQTDGEAPPWAEPESPVNEINELEAAFNNMLERVGRVISLEKEKTRAELNALQCQINPHFLCNSFELIKWLSDSGEKEKVERMVNNLTQLFRLGINEKKTWITLEEEAGYTQAYLNIQKMRYEDILKVHWDLTPELLELLVPKLILQPLVENSIYHGIREIENGVGTIEIRGRICNGYCILQISDNGKGFQKERLAEIREHLAHPESYRESIGLFNVNKRLRLFYGEAYQIQIQSEPFVKTTITLRLPIRHRTEGKG